MPTDIEDPGPAGDAARAAFGATMLALHTPQFCCGGLNFGSFYERSPIIAYDGEAAPGYTMDDFTPSTVPGCRTPHVWLRDGRSLYDAMGAGFTLLRFDPSADVDTIVAAARARRLPLSVLDVVSDEAPGCIGTSWCCRARISMSRGAAMRRRRMRWGWSIGCAARDGST